MQSLAAAGRIPAAALLLPESGGLVGVDARTTEAIGQKAAGGEGLIAQHLGGEASRGGVREKTISGVDRAGRSRRR